MSIIITDSIHTHHNPVLVKPTSNPLKMSQAKKPAGKIMPFHQRPNMSKDQVISNMKLLNAAIKEIYNKRSSDLSYEELYRTGYNLVLNSHGNVLYEGIKTTLSEQVNTSREQVLLKTTDALLSSILNEWDTNKLAFNSIANIMMYMDRVYCTKQRKPPVLRMSYQLFSDYVVHNPALNERLRTTMLGNVSRERAGDIIDRDCMKSVLNMLVDLSVDENVYERDFESPFLEETREFYIAKSLAYLSSSTCSDYLYMAESWLNEEMTRVSHYLAASTGPKLKHLLEQELVATHAKALLDPDNTTGLTSMLRDSKYEDLSRFHSLFSKIPFCLDQMRTTFACYVRDEGLKIVDGQESKRDPVAFVGLVLQLQDKFEVTIRKAFKNEKKFEKKQKEAFEDFLNRDHRCASHLASYNDEMLRNGLTGSSEEEIDSKLDKAVKIFKYLTDKDIFENYYKVLLSKRLLNGKTGSDEVEKSMLAKLKTECGYQFTSKMEGMFMDLKISKQNMEEYRKSANFSESTVELDVSMLTTSNWPFAPFPACALPDNIVRGCEAYEAFYAGKHSERKLSWLTNQGTAEMRVHFPQGTKDLIVTTYQMCILMIFNNVAAGAPSSAASSSSSSSSLSSSRAEGTNPTISLEFIRQKLGSAVPELELRRHLLSLCTPKLRILRKSSKGKGIEDNETFSVNDEFTSKFKRIKVPLVSAKEVMPASGSVFELAVASAAGASDARTLGDEDGGVPPQVEEERRHQIEAAIVRIMKSRKALAHNELVAEVCRQLAVRFTPIPHSIKKRIESLIEREYIQRHKDDPKQYNYMA